MVTVEEAYNLLSELARSSARSDRTSVDLSLRRLADFLVVANDPIRIHISKRPYSDHRKLHNFHVPVQSRRILFQTLVKLKPK